MTGSISSIIPFDSGRAYVIRGIEVTRPEWVVLDRLNRTEEDRQFLEDFEALFLAASKGDLATCKAVVKGGFTDLHATSVGRFGYGPGEYLNNISPIHIAEMKGHTKVSAYFNKVLQKRGSEGKPEASCSYEVGEAHPLSTKGVSDQDAFWGEFWEEIDQIASREESVPLKRKSVKKKLTHEQRMNRAIRKNESPEMIMEMLQQAVKKKGFDSGQCILWLMTCMYSEEIVLFACHHAKQVSNECFVMAGAKGYSLEVISTLILRAQQPQAV